MEAKERGPVPHYKCEACKVRLHVSGRPAELLGDTCPHCGLVLKPVAELADLVGYRLITSPDGNAQRRLDDGDGSRAAEVALPPPQTYL